MCACSWLLALLLVAVVGAAPGSRGDTEIEPAPAPSSTFSPPPKVFPKVPDADHEASEVQDLLGQDEGTDTVDHPNVLDPGRTHEQGSKPANTTGVEFHMCDFPRLWPATQQSACSLPAEWFNSSHTLHICTVERSWLRSHNLTSLRDVSLLADDTNSSSVHCVTPGDPSGDPSSETSEDSKSRYSDQLPRAWLREGNDIYFYLLPEDGESANTSATNLTAESQKDNSTEAHPKPSGEPATNVTASPPKDNATSTPVTDVQEDSAPANTTVTASTLDSATNGSSSQTNSSSTNAKIVMGGVDASSTAKIDTSSPENATTTNSSQSEAVPPTNEDLSTVNALSTAEMKVTSQEPDSADNSSTKAANMTPDSTTKDASNVTDSEKNSTTKNASIVSDSSKDSSTEDANVPDSRNNSLTKDGSITPDSTTKDASNVTDSEKNSTTKDANIVPDSSNDSSTKDANITPDSATKDASNVTDSEKNSTTKNASIVSGSSKDSSTKDANIVPDSSKDSSTKDANVVPDSSKDSSTKDANVVPDSSKDSSTKDANVVPDSSKDSSTKDANRGPDSDKDGSTEEGPRLNSPAGGDTGTSSALLQRHADHDHGTGRTAAFLQPTESAAILAGVFVGIAVLGYVGLLAWRRYLERRYGHREMLVNEDDDFDTSDMRHFEL